jgi:S-adenosylmethionine-diacylgycerolhomoserine-N-methlytransferase
VSAIPQGTANADKLTRYYRWHARIYDPTRWLFLFGRQRLVDHIALEQGSRPARILELGCGTGINLLTLAKRCPKAELVGCDLSQEMLARARAKMCALPESDKRRITLAAGELTQFALQQFDWIICSYVLSMTGDALESTLTQLRSLLTGNGKLAVVDFESTRFAAFKSWMQINHVQMGLQSHSQHDGRLLHALKRQAAHHEEHHRAYGLWNWLLRIGR